jgi:hypothetical protein
MKRISIPALVVFCASFLSLSWGQNQPAAYHFTTIALSGDPAPGAPGQSFSYFGSALVNDAGQALFYSVTNANPDGYWFRDAAGNLSLVAVRFNAVPVLPGIQFYDVFDRPVVLNTTGQFLFGTALVGAGVTTSNDIALWLRNTNGTLTLVARKGDPAPGWPGTPHFASFFSRYDLNDSGQIAFTGEIDLVPGQGGIWLRDSAGAVSLAVRFGDPAPCTASSFLSFEQPELASSGVMFFEAYVSGFGVWSRDNAGTISCVAYKGMPAPGIPGASLGKATSSTPLMRKKLNRAGEMALFSIVSGAAVTDANDHAIWFRDTGGNLTLVAREGDPAPGTGAGIIFASLLGTTDEPVRDIPSLNGAGQVAFTASLSGPGVGVSNDTGFWLWNKPGTLALIARKGDQVPGATPGTVFAGFSAATNSLMNQIQLNDTGEIFFPASFSGPDVTTANDHGLAVWSAAGGLRLVVREGDSLQVAAGDSRIINAFLEPGAPALNNKGQVVFWAGFGASYGVFLASPGADSTPPVITPVVTGTLGDNGWYRSDVSVAWQVTEPDPGSTISSTQGCGTSTVTSDTNGITFTCTATSNGGTNTASVTIKRDTVPPSVLVVRPANGATYNRNYRVTASYRCSDSRSGIAQCTGTGPNGSPIDTSSTGTKSFTVNAQDQAGNTRTVTVRYRVRKRSPDNEEHEEREE